MSDGVDEEFRETEEYQEHLDRGGCPCGYWQCNGTCAEFN